MSLIYHLENQVSILIDKVTSLEKKVSVLSQGVREAKRVTHRALNQRPIPEHFILPLKGQEVWADDLYEAYRTDHRNEPMTERYFHQQMMLIPGIQRIRAKKNTIRKDGDETIVEAIKKYLYMIPERGQE